MLVNITILKSLLELLKCAHCRTLASSTALSTPMKASKCTRTERVFADEKEDAIIVEYSIETSDGNKEVSSKVNRLHSELIMNLILIAALKITNSLCLKGNRSKFSRNQLMMTQMFRDWQGRLSKGANTSLLLGCLKWKTYWLKYRNGVRMAKKQRQNRMHSTELTKSTTTSTKR